MGGTGSAVTPPAIPNSTNTRGRREAHCVL
nr:MAG TPA: hypothetical protein [Caudoviricetes sp.]